MHFQKCIARNWGPQYRCFFKCPNAGRTECTYEQWLQDGDVVTGGTHDDCVWWCSHDGGWRRFVIETLMSSNDVVKKECQRFARAMHLQAEWRRSVIDAIMAYDNDVKCSILGVCG